jgi:hypothetical protein
VDPFQVDELEDRMRDEQAEPETQAIEISSPLGEKLYALKNQMCFFFWKQFYL